MESNYANMRDIGSVVGMSSHVIGRLLKQHGYRNDAGKPTAKAWIEKMVREVLVDGFTAFVWDCGRVRELAVNRQPEPAKPDNTPNYAEVYYF